MATNEIEIWKRQPRHSKTAKLHVMVSLDCLLELLQARHSLYSVEDTLELLHGLADDARAAGLSDQKDLDAWHKVLQAVPPEDGETHGEEEAAEEA